MTLQEYLQRFPQDLGDDVLGAFRAMGYLSSDRLLVLLQKFRDGQVIANEERPRSPSDGLPSFSVMTAPATAARVNVDQYVAISNLDRALKRLHQYRPNDGARRFVSERELIEMAPQVMRQAGKRGGTAPKRSTIAIRKREAPEVLQTIERMDLATLVQTTGMERAAVEKMGALDRAILTGLIIAGYWTLPHGHKKGTRADIAIRYGIGDRRVSTIAGLVWSHPVK